MDWIPIQVSRLSIEEYEKCLRTGICFQCKEKDHRRAEYLNQEKTICIRKKQSVPIKNKNQIQKKKKNTKNEIVKKD